MIQAGSRFGNYTIIRQLGAGGMSDVFEALDLTLQRHVALKIMPPEFSLDDERNKRFRKEVLAVAALDHPGIVTIFEVNRAEGCDYYSMTLARNGNLKQLIYKGSLNPRRSLRIIRSVAEALGHAHEHGIVHRDIKPENILFSNADQPLLADFGIVKTLGSSTKITAVGTSVGTPYYMSPEQAQATKVDPRSDIYSLGVVLFEMLKGAVPYEATTTIGIALQHVNDPVPKLPGKLAVFQPLIERMMAKVPKDRYQDTGKLIEAIDRLRAELAPASGKTDPSIAAERAAQVTAPPPTGKRSSKKTAPPPSKASKATKPPPSKASKATTPPSKSAARPKPAAPRPPTARPDPATEFDLMVVTPDPAGLSLTASEASAAESSGQKTEGTAPSEPAVAERPPTAPRVPPQSSALPAAPSGTPATPPRSAASGRAPAQSVAKTDEAPPAPPRTATPPFPRTADRPKPPRRRVNTGTPPPAAATPDRHRQSMEFYLRPGSAWYRRPLTYILASALAAVVVVVLLLKMSLPSKEPTPLELITGRGGARTPVSGSPDTPASAVAGTDAAAPRPAAPDPDATAVQGTPLPKAASEPAEPSRAEVLEQLLVEELRPGDRTSTVGPDPADELENSTETGPAGAPARSTVITGLQAESSVEAMADGVPAAAVERDAGGRAGAEAESSKDSEPPPARTAIDAEAKPQRLESVAVSNAGADALTGPASDPVERIAPLLTTAASQRAANRLVPPGENAWETYQQVLELDPGNREARAGIDAIESAYRELVRAALAAGKLDAAGAYLERLQTIAPIDPAARALGRELTAARAATTAARAPAAGREIRDDLASGGSGPLLVVIGAGEFQMGADDGEAGERPVHPVSVDSYAIGKYEITRAQFGAFAAATDYRSSAESAGGCNYWLFGWRLARDKNWRSPGFEQGENEPVVCVSRADAQAYADWLSRETGRRYGLPSEAQWEFAGESGSAYWGDNADACRHANVSDLTRAAEHSLEDDPSNVFGCQDGYVTTAPVGSFALNAAGLADMLGNAGEWTADCAGPNYQGAPTDGSPRRDGDCQWGIVRGGSWFELPANVRPTKRLRLGADDRFSHIGFRVVREIR